mmetsp:Transcript_67950/g.107832  ORF Transcript_67950/g.107832 Transcript_67950/m.107832 type:complete len:146 (-) Transcript_67950:197-634(-)|eukprot:CAMPEP_0197055090 /NCGR_PEP_ID=MMETSP1384-20130603/57456_1 /TAXON_ID=29189 /ORGANISM="Ammonia sp." /LENGTH=145 /DNA_ID=CAMNT_0042488539 /DNA_START=48 /DNA_END=485 /DNA_ORIENTATION=+
MSTWRRIKHVIVPGLPVVQGAFCHASVYNDIVWISGTIAAFVDDAGKNRLIDEGVYEQTKMILESIEKILTASGTSMKNVVNLKVFLANNTTERYSQMNSAYVEFFKSRQLEVPSRITVGCSSLALGADVEIDGMAVIPPPDSKL